MKRYNQNIKDMVINRIASFPYNMAIYNDCLDVSINDCLDVSIFVRQFVHDFYADGQRVEKFRNVNKLYSMVRRYVINYINDSDIKRMYKGHYCFTYMTNECNTVYTCKPHRELAQPMKINYILASRNDKLKDKC